MKIHGYQTFITGIINTQVVGHIEFSDYTNEEMKAGSGYKHQEQTNITSEDPLMQMKLLPKLTVTKEKSNINNHRTKRQILGCCP